MLHEIVVSVKGTCMLDECVQVAVLLAPEIRCILIDEPAAGIMGYLTILSHFKQAQQIQYTSRKVTTLTIYSGI